MKKILIIEDDSFLQGLESNKLKKDIQKCIDEDKKSEAKVEDETEPNTIEE